ncbi:MAG TPA: amino acid ABC transporter substrate-binding protein [Burkholderiales bacterium]|nr:amino acid ABC transporter substrate-binding protein [Burkholderiales bacterium]
MKKFMMALAVMCACAATALAAEAPDPLKKIKATRTITLGYSETAVPFSFVGNDNRPQGYSVDLCKRIADGIQQQLGLTELKINWVKVDVATRIPATMKGTVDIECGSTTHTLSREEQVDFSNMTFVDGGSFISKARNKLATIKELAGRKISVIPGTTTEKVLKAALDQAQVRAEIIPVQTHAEGFSSLREDRVDAYASDRMILIGLALNAIDAQSYRLSDEMFSYEPYALMMRRDADFRLAVNRELARLYRSGDILNLYARWYGPLGEPSTLLKAMYFLNALPE